MQHQPNLGSGSMGQGGAPSGAGLAGAAAAQTNNVNNLQLKAQQTSSVLSGMPQGNPENNQHNSKSGDLTNKAA